jgi:hypothetical protein
VLGCDSQDEVFRRAFLRSPKERGLTGVRPVISDRHAGAVVARDRDRCPHPRLLDVVASVRHRGVRPFTVRVTVAAPRGRGWSV